MDKYITSNDIAETLGVCMATARSIMREMPHFQKGGVGKRRILLVKEKDFARYMEDHIIPAGAEEPRKTPFMTEKQTQEELRKEWHRQRRAAIRDAAL